MSGGDCDSIKVKVDAEFYESRKRQLNFEWELHKVCAENSYQKLKEDAAYAKCHCDTEMFTFDLEKSLPTPVLTTGVVYYKRKLWTYNQGIHDCTKTRGVCIWGMRAWHLGALTKCGIAFSHTRKISIVVQPTSSSTVMPVEGRIEISAWLAFGYV